MIQSKEDLEYYLEQDALMLGMRAKSPSLFHHDEIWTFQILMRKCEYYINCRNDFWSCYWLGKLQSRYFRIANTKGYEIPFNIFGPGLSIAHSGTIIINGNARVGKNCRINGGTTIGSTGFYSQKAPIIGDNVYIGTGAKIIGDIRIADNVVIGANAVVVKDISEPGTTWAGVPARKISNNDSSGHIASPEIEGKYFK